MISPGVCLLTPVDKLSLFDQKLLENKLEIEMVRCVLFFDFLFVMSNRIRDFNNFSSSGHQNFGIMKWF